MLGIFPELSSQVKRLAHGRGLDLTEEDAEGRLVGWLVVDASLSHC